MNLSSLATAFLLAALGTVVSTSPCRSQARIVGWGNRTCDTEWTTATDFVDVAAGLGNSFALRTDGTIAVPGFLRPPALPTGMRYQQVSAYEWGVAAIRSDGNVIEWGDPLGLTPVPILPPGVTYTQIAAGPMFRLARRSDGQIVGWGDNAHQQLAVPPLPPGTTYVAVSAGYRYALALRSDGALVAWGDNSLGQCNVPARPPGTQYAQFEAAPFHAVALRSDGMAVAWGDSRQGATAVPALPPGTSWRWLAAGAECSFGCRSDGQLLAWGSNSYGHCDVPPLPAGVDFARVAVGLTHTAAIRSDGRLEVWGATTVGRPLPLPGQGTSLARLAVNERSVVAVQSDGLLYLPDLPTALPTLPAGVHYVDADAAGGDYVVAVRSDGSAVQAGMFGSLTPAPVPLLPSGTGYVTAATDGAHTLALRSDGVLVAWGGSIGGPVVVPFLPAGLRYEAMATTLSYTQGEAIALRSDGALVHWLWANGATTVIPSPGGGIRFVAVEGGYGRLFALRNDGQIDCWPAGSANLPPPAPGTGYVEVASDLYGTIVRRSDGVLVETSHYQPVPWLATPPLRPGECFLEIAAGSTALRVGIVGPTSSYSRFGVGCAGTRPASRLVPRDTPRIGRPLRVTAFDLPIDMAVLVAGFSTTNSGWVPLPIELTSFGMPGCWLRTSVDAAVVLVGQNGVAEHRFTIPSDATLVGVRLHQQALVLDPAAGNPLGAVVSDAMTAILGK